jgi:hypothetical protein
LIKFKSKYFVRILLKVPLTPYSLKLDAYCSSRYAGYSDFSDAFQYRNVVALVFAMSDRGIISTADEGPTIVIMTNSVDTARPKANLRHTLRLLDLRAAKKSSNHKYES